MRSLRPFAPAALLAVFVLALLLPARTAANGGKAKMLRLEDRVSMEGGRICHFLCEIDPTLFPLLTLKDRYKVARIQVRNDARQRVVLSRQTDTVELVFGERRLPGIVDLAQHDAALWDLFSPDLRKALLYPAEVEPGEEESLFVFVPAGGVDTPPREIRLTIATLPRPVTLRHLVAAAKN